MAARRLRPVLLVALVGLAPATWTFAADLMVSPGLAGGDPERQRAAKAVVVRDVLRATSRRTELEELQSAPPRPSGHGGTIMPIDPPFDPATLPACEDRRQPSDRAAQMRLHLWADEARFRLFADRVGSIEAAAFHACLVATPFGAACARRIDAARHFSTTEVVRGLITLGAMERRGRSGCWRAEALR